MNAKKFFYYLGIFYSVVCALVMFCITPHWFLALLSSVILFGMFLLLTSGKKLNSLVLGEDYIIYCVICMLLVGVLYLITGNIADFFKLETLYYFVFFIGATRTAKAYCTVNKYSTLVALDSKKELSFIMYWTLIMTTFSLHMFGWVAVVITGMVLYDFAHYEPIYCHLSHFAKKVHYAISALLMLGASLMYFNSSEKSWVVISILILLICTMGANKYIHPGKSLKDKSEAPA